MWNDWKWIFIWNQGTQILDFSAHYLKNIFFSFHFLFFKSMFEKTHFFSLFPTSLFSFWRIIWRKWQRKQFITNTKNEQIFLFFVENRSKRTSTLHSKCSFSFSLFSEKRKIFRVWRWQQRHEKNLHFFPFKLSMKREKKKGFVKGFRKEKDDFSFLFWYEKRKWSLSFERNYIKMIYIIFPLTENAPKKNIERKKKSFERRRYQQSFRKIIRM